MPVETNIRTRRPSAAVLALQAAKGTAVDDLRISANGLRCWTQKVTIPVGKEKTNPRWMNEMFADNASGRVNTRDQNDGKIFAVATPESVRRFLESNWGTMTGSPLVSTLTSQVNKYATLAWIESYRVGATQNLVRLSDVFLYKLKFSFRRVDGKLLIEADYSGRRSSVTPLASLGLIQITTSPMTPVDVRVYNVRNATFVRDPAGANVSLDFIELDVTLDQQVSSEWTYSDGWDVWKRGNTSVYIRFVARLSDEYWAILTDSSAGTQRRFVITARSDGSPQSVLTMDFKSVDFKFEEIGHDEGNGCLVEATGRAFLTAQTPETGFVKFTIT